MSDTVQQVKERLNIVDVVSPYVKLTKSGKYWKGLSPFNKEKTPSFYVSPDRGLYHCFSSGKGGDMFTFVEEMEGVDFKGALKILAEKAGVPLVYEKGNDKSERDRLYQALDAAKDFFTSQLARREDAAHYLAARGVTPASISAWSLGYAAKEWRVLSDHLKEKGFSDEEIERAGLAKRADSPQSTVHSAEDSGLKTKNLRFYDRFRGRIMFPIRDISGRTIGFTGRIFEDDAEHPQAKYLNSPETVVFEKSKILYGIDRAREAIRTYDFAILVEGQVDLLMVHQTGYTNAVALSGTAFTEDHARLIGRYTKNLVIAFDGDRAGVSAAGRAAAIALTAGLNVKVATMPPGEDPADLVKRDSALWKQAIKEAVHVVDFYLAYVRDSGYDARKFKLEVSRVVLPYVALVTNAIDQAHFVSRVADSIGAPEESVRMELAKLKKGDASQTETTSTFEPFLSRGASLERLIAGVRAAGGDEAALAELSPEDRRAALIEGDVFLERYPDPADRDAAIAELEDALTKELIREKYRETIVRLKNAEGMKDAAGATALMQELATLAKQL